MTKRPHEKEIAGEDTGEFTILLVEDEYESIKDQIGPVKEHVETNGFKFNLILRGSEKQVEAVLADTDIDIVVTDKNLESDNGGLVVIEEVEKRGHLTDILFYSSIKYDKRKMRDNTDYGFVEMIEGRDFARPLIKMVDKNLRRSNSIGVLRGILISKVIEIELKVNKVLAEYFIPETSEGNRDRFHTLVLENRYNSFEGKVRTLAGVLDDSRVKGDPEFEGFKKKLGELQQNRNLLAHCKKDPDKPGCLVAMGEEEHFDRQRVLDLFQTAKEVSKTLDYLQKKISPNVPTPPAGS
jgi:hypothetical protein